MPVRGVGQAVRGEGAQQPTGRGAAARFRDIYNRIRPHPSLDDRTPREAYAAGG
jgi:transposase InsO family protein